MMTRSSKKRPRDDTEGGNTPNVPKRHCRSNTYTKPPDSVEIQNPGSTRDPIFINKPITPDSQDDKKEYTHRIFSDNNSETGDTDPELQKALIQSLHEYDGRRNSGNEPIPEEGSSTSPLPYLSAISLREKTRKEAYNYSFNAIKNIRMNYKDDYFWVIVHNAINNADGASKLPIQMAEELIQWILRSGRMEFDSVEKLFVRFMVMKFKMQEGERPLEEKAGPWTAKSL